MPETEKESFVSSHSVQPQLQFLFCAKFHCQPSEYIERAFRKLLYSRAKPLAPLFRNVTRDFFAEDLRFIRDLGEALDMREANLCAAEFQDANSWDRSFLRRCLKIRVSGLKALKLAEQLFSTVQS